MRIQTVREREERLLASQHLASWTASFFGSVAVLLAALGLYGMLSQAVLSPRGEMGVRVAVGASLATVAWLILKQVLWVLFFGAVFGLLMAWAASRAVVSFVYEASATDPKILLAALTILVVGTLAAACAPVQRAMAVNLLEALR